MSIREAMRREFLRVLLTLTLTLFTSELLAQSSYYLASDGSDNYTSSSTYSYNGGTRRKRNREIRKYKNKYGMESHESYEFKSCSQFNKEDSNPDYFITCKDGELVQDSSFEKLIGSTKAIEAKLYKDHLLDELKDHTLKELDQNINQLDMIKTCIELKTGGLSLGETCQQLLPNILSVVKDQLPQMRATMAMMDKPQNMRGYKAPLYKSDIKHKVPTGKIPRLTKKEREKIKEESDAIKYNFEQEWYANNIDQNKCIEQVSPTTYRFKPSQTKYSCESYNVQKLNQSVKDKFKDFREKLKDNYYQMIGSNPLLAHLNLTGEESEEKILKEVQNTVSKLINDSTKSRDQIKNLPSEDIASLIRKDNIVESYIGKRGATEVLCDAAQDLKDSEDFNELKTDLFLAGGALIGGGICAFTAGVGCLIGVGVASEAVGIAVAQDRYESAAISFNSGLTSAQTYEDRKFERDFTLLLAPISVAGDLIGTGAQVGRKAYKFSPKGNAFDPDLVGIVKRDAFRKRTALLQDALSTSKARIIKQYEDFILVPPKLNGRWIDVAKSGNAGLYLDVENAALKRLNDTIGDKSFVTALTNVHKDILSTKLNKLLEKYPNIDIEVYSDFKSVRYAFKPKDMPDDLRAKLMKDLNATYKDANEEFAKKVKTMEGIPDTEYPEQWFQGGLGLTADQAGQSAKKARQLTRPAQLTSFDEIKGLIDQDTKAIRDYSNKLTSNHPLAKAGLIDEIPGSKTKTVSLPVFEVVRKVKSPTPQELSVFKEEISKELGRDISSREANEILMGRRLANELNTKFGSQLSDTDAQELLSYSNGLDSLTPGLWVKERVSANLNDAVNGGMSGDVTGMGARNIRQVAYDIAQNPRSDASSVIDSTRKGEQAVTQTFDDIKQNFRTTVQDVLEQRGIKYSDPCSGDDCVMIPKTKLSNADENALVTAFAKQDNPSQYRLSFIPDGVKGSDRTNLAVHGELVEKELRKRLIGVSNGKISYDKLSQITIATKMPGKINDGGVGLILGIGDNAKLTQADKDLISSALDGAVKKVNESLAKEAPGTNFSYGAGKIDWLE